MPNCVVCGNKISFGEGNWKLMNGEKICTTCRQKAGFRPFEGDFRDPAALEYGQRIQSFLQKPADEVIRKIIDAIYSGIPIDDITRITKREISTKLKATKQIGEYLWINELDRTWMVRDESSMYNFTDINSFELIENGSSISRGGVGRALLGGILLGGIGAIVGGITAKRKNESICESLRLMINLNDFNKPIIFINFIYTPILKNSQEYLNLLNHAQECLAYLHIMCNKVPQNQNESFYAADEILKYKKLLDEGAITNDEYESKKKQLLNL